jgi:hypothetical protein
MRRGISGSWGRPAGSAGGTSVSVTDLLQCDDGVLSKRLIEIPSEVFPRRCWFEAEGNWEGEGARGGAVWRDGGLGEVLRRVAMKREWLQYMRCIMSVANATGRSSWR